MIKKKLLVHLGMGGHTSQMLHLLQLLGNNFDNNFYYSYLIGHDDQTSGKKIPYAGPVHIVNNPRLMSDASVWQVAFKMVPTSWQVFRLLLKVKPDAILSSGPSLAIPLFWIAKLLRIKTIFVESWVRVHHKSQAGKLVYLVSDLFFVQWESLKQVYPKAIYAGRLS